MKNLLLGAIFLLIGTSLVFAQDDTDAGKDLFKSNCAACHTVGKGKLTGPDLKNVSDRLSIDWIIPFVKNSAAVIESGDEYAVKIFNEYNKVPMSAHPHLSDTDIKNIVAYIDLKSNEVVETAVSQSTGGQTSLENEFTVIGHTNDSVIDMPLVKMVFWGSVIVLSMVLLSLSIVLVRLTK